MVALLLFSLFRFLLPLLADCSIKLIFLNHSLEFTLRICTSVPQKARDPSVHLPSFVVGASSSASPVTPHTAHPLKVLTFRILSLTVFKQESRQLDTTNLEAQASVAHSLRREFLCHLHFRSKTVPVAAPAQIADRCYDHPSWILQSINRVDSSAALASGPVLPPISAAPNVARDCSNEPSAPREPCHSFAFSTAALR